MCPSFTFMTGATRYRVQAKDREEAMQLALAEFGADENTRAVIRATMYDEDDAKKYVSSIPPGEADDDDGEDEG